MGGATGFGKRQPFKQAGPSLQHLQSQFTGLRQRPMMQPAQPAAARPVAFAPRMDQITTTSAQFGAPQPRDVFGRTGDDRRAFVREDDQQQAEIARLRASMADGSYYQPMQQQARSLFASDPRTYQRVRLFDIFGFK